MDELLRAHPGFAAGLALEGRAEGELLPGRDLLVVAKYLVPTDAYVVQGCLAASGVPAVVADANHVQADLLIAPALGGVRVLVPACFLEQARAILEALERGDYALGEDADVGEAE